MEFRCKALVVLGETDKLAFHSAITLLLKYGSPGTNYYFYCKIFFSCILPICFALQER